MNSSYTNNNIYANISYNNNNSYANSSKDIVVDYLLTLFYGTGKKLNVREQQQRKNEKKRSKKKGR